MICFALKFPQKCAGHICIICIRIILHGKVAGYPLVFKAILHHQYVCLLVVLPFLGFANVAVKNIHPMMLINPAMFIAGLIARHKDMPLRAIGPREPSKIKPVRTQVPDFSGQQSNRSS